MKFGLLYEIEVLQPWDENSHRNAFWEALDQIKLAEEVGFDYAWCVEHHFLGEFSISSPSATTTRFAWPSAPPSSTS